MRVKQKQKKGFTILELLMVMAIIVILSGIVFVLIGKGSDTKIKAALATAKQIMPFAQECVYVGADLNCPGGPRGENPGDSICPGSAGEWPTIKAAECSYQITNAVDGNYQIVCPTITTEAVVCNSRNGDCKIQ